MKSIIDMRNLLIVISVLCFNSLLIAQEAPEGLFIHSKAPDFKATSQYKSEVRLRDLVKKGKVVLVFYRGQWSPYCNRYLKRLQDSLQFITEKGATVIAVSPEKPENIALTVEKTKAEFSILHDEGLKIMKAYDVDYEVPENTLKQLKNTGIDLSENNGKNGNFLPITATYIIDKESTVIYRFFDKDYKKSPSVKDILNNLK